MIRKQMMNRQIRFISQSQIQLKHLNEKPKCPQCGNSLVFVYGQPESGYLMEKCHKCKAKVWIDLSDMECQLVVSDEALEMAN